VSGIRFGKGSGDISGPAGATTDNAIARWDGVTGTKLQDSSVLIDDSDNITGVVALTMSSNLTLSGATASRALTTDGSKIVAVSVTTAAELAFVNNVTSAIQTQLDAKLAEAGSSTDNAIVTWNGTGGDAVDEDATATLSASVFKIETANSVAPIMTVKSTSTANPKVVIEATATTQAPLFEFKAGNRGANASLAFMCAFWNGNPVAAVKFTAGDDGTNDDEGLIEFLTRTSGDAVEVQRWQFSHPGHFLAFADNVYDIGAASANRPRTVNVGTNVNVGAEVNITRSDSTNALLTIKNDTSTANAPRIDLRAPDRATEDNTLYNLYGFWGDSNPVTCISTNAGADTVNKDEGAIRFATRDSGDANVIVRVSVEKSGTLTLKKDLAHQGTNIGFFNTTPAAQASAYTPTNVSTDRAYDANATTVDEIADVLGTLIADLKTYGLLQ